MAEEEVWYSCKVAEERGEVSSLGNHRGFSDAVVTVRGGQVYLGAQPRIKVIAQAAGLFKGVNGNRNIIRRNGDRTDDRLSQVVLFNEPSQQCANYIARAGPNEEWKPVRVFTDKRIVQSIDGRILSNMNGASLMPGDTVKDVYISNYGRVATLGWSIERLSVDGGGYVKYCGHLVHRLVALLFVPNDDPVGKPHVDHAHGNPADNRASELQWMSQKENNAKRQFVMPTYCLTWCEGDDFYAYCDDGLFQSIPLDTEKVTRALTQRRISMEAGVMWARRAFRCMCKNRQRDERRTRRFLPTTIRSTCSPNELTMTLCTWGMECLRERGHASQRNCNCLALSKLVVQLRQSCGDRMCWCSKATSSNASASGKTRESEQGREVGRGVGEKLVVVTFWSTGFVRKSENLKKSNFWPKSFL
jgi:hypothetical protein